MSRRGWRDDNLSIARGVTTTIAIANHAPPADCACDASRTICVEIETIFADRTHCGAVAIVVNCYGFAANHTRHPAIAVAVSAYVAAADRTRRVAILIGVNAYAFTADRTSRVA